MEISVAREHHVSAMKPHPLGERTQGDVVQVTPPQEPRPTMGDWDPDETNALFYFLGLPSSAEKTNTLQSRTNQFADNGALNHLPPVDGIKYTYVNEQGKGPQKCHFPAFPEGFESVHKNQREERATQPQQSRDYLQDEPGVYDFIGGRGKGEYVSRATSHLCFSLRAFISRLFFTTIQSSSRKFSFQTALSRRKGKRKNT